jgi:hypothetical protein
VIHVVAVQDQPAEAVLRIEGNFEIAAARAWRTSGDEDLREVTGVVFRANAMSITLPGRGMLTLIVARSRKPAPR